MEAKQSKGRLLRRFLPYYKKYWKTVVFDLLCAGLTTVCELVLPLIVREITSAATNDIAALTVEMVLRLGLFYLVLRIIDTAAQYYMASVGHIMGARLETDMRADLFAHLQKLPFSYFDETKIGTLMSRITSDLFDVTEFAHHCPEELLITGIKIICAFAILAGMNLPLTLIMFSVIPIMIVVLTVFNRRMRDGFRESRRRVGELNSQVEDSLLGIRVVKSFAQEDAEVEKFVRGNNRFLEIKTKVYGIMAAFQASTRLFDGVMYIIVVVIGAFFLRKNMIEAADYVAYLMYVSTLLTSIRRIVEFAEQFQRGMTGIERFCEIVDIEPSITDAPNAQPMERVTGEIRFDNVRFRYSDESGDVLSHLDLTVKPGESIALVGPSGGGKTTLCNLIPRFYDLTDGCIRIDGRDVREITLSTLRQNIGVVAQDVYLFSGSVRENIAYGRPGASDEEIAEAARLAGAHEFISQLPDGYNTYVGERGVKLSGGQKQRISIARLFLKNPPILILDEATSALDNESERLVQQSLEALAKGRTTITIAHRLTTIRGADRILVLTPSGIAEEGSHAELLKQGGIYADLYKLYGGE
ncbi:MAG: ABC transporter ATP-binding protein [Clostridia bacterium]|nr:ABC transporter ATP-binding protein [Clostridia bacterium]